MPADQDDALVEAMLAAWYGAPDVDAGDEVMRRVLATVRAHDGAAARAQIEALTAERDARDERVKRLEGLLREHFEAHFDMIDEYPDDTIAETVVNVGELREIRDALTPEAPDAD